MRPPSFLSESENEGNTVLDFTSIWWTFKAFQKAQRNKNMGRGKKAQELKNQVCQTSGLLETIIIFVWTKFQQPGFGVEMDILLREWLQVENRARGVEGVLAGNMRFFLRRIELGSVVQTFDLQNLGVWQDEESRRRIKCNKWWKAGKKEARRKKELHARKQ